MTKKKKEPEISLKPRCPYCSAEWTDDMVTVENLYASQGCPTCGHGSSIDGTIDIHCSNCKKLIYRKEFSERG